MTKFKPKILKYIYQTLLFFRNAFSKMITFLPLGRKAHLL